MDCNINWFVDVIGEMFSDASNLTCEESGDVVITSVDDLSVYCLLHHLEQETDSVSLTEAGQHLKDVFQHAPFLEERRGKLKRLVEAHSDKLTLTRYDVVIFRKAWTYGSATKPKQKAQKKNLEPQREKGTTATASKADPFYSAVKYLINNEGRPPVVGNSSMPESFTVMQKKN